MGSYWASRPTTPPQQRIYFSMVYSPCDILEYKYFYNTVSFEVNATHENFKIIGLANQKKNLTFVI